jgi:hypothetical protein
MYNSSPVSGRAARIKFQRYEALQTFLHLKSLMGNQRAARIAGHPFQTIYVWQQAFAAGGFDALRPRHTNSGRRSKAATLLSDEAILELEGLLMQMGQRRAWQQFVASQLCPPALARSGLRSLPAPVARQVNLTPLRARCRAFLSADGKRLLARIKLGGTSK